MEAAWAKVQYSPKAISDPTYEATFKRNWLASLPSTKVGKDNPEPTATPTNRRPLSSFGG